MTTEQVDRTSLPMRRQPFKGVANQTLYGSKPDWEIIGHLKAPAGAPSVLCVLIDDAGIGNPSTFGGPMNSPNFTRVADEAHNLQDGIFPAACIPLFDHPHETCSPPWTQM